MQIFHRSTNFLSRVSIFGAVFFLAILLWLFYDLEASPYTTQQNMARDQPVQFSHAHHVGAIGIDCRYCHTSVEKAAFAGIPPTKTCMNCHSQIWAQSPYLEPVRASFRNDTSLEWTRVNDLPDFVYFDHSIHVAKGVGCETCHGRVDQMPLMYQAATLQMRWCLDCHRNPEKYLRPKDQVFTMGWRPPVEQAVLGERLKREYHIRGRAVLESCSTCHR
jgi:Cytochrome c7 and related cytochrome c